MGATSGAGTAYPSGAPEFTPGFCGVRVTQSISFMCMFCRSLFVLLAIVLSIHHRFTDFDYPFGLFKLFLAHWFTPGFWLLIFLVFCVVLIFFLCLVYPILPVSLD